MAGKKEVLTQQFIDDLEGDLTALSDELSECLEKKAAGRRARKLTSDLAKKFMLFRKLSVQHDKR